MARARGDSNLQKSKTSIYQITRQTYTKNVQCPRVNQWVSQLLD